MFKRLLVAGIACALAITVSAPRLVRASASSPFAYLADSATLTGTPLISGSVRDANGAPVAADLTLLAMASEDALTRMQVGDTVKMLPAGRATSDASGSFGLRLDPSVDIAGYRAASGWTNFQILASSPEGKTAYSFSRHASAPGGAIGTFESTAAPVALTLDRSLRDTNGGIAAPAAVNKTTCVESLQSTYSPTWDSVAELYTKTHETVDFQYSSGATSTLGVGYSVSGTYGTFSASGTTTKGSTATIDFATVGTNNKRVERTQFRYGLYYDICWYEQGFYDDWYLAKVKDFVGGSTYYTAASYPGASHCTPYQTGDHVTIDQHSAVTWSNGVSISAYIGIDLSTRTGFTTTAKQYWSFVSAGSLCGTNDYPFQAVTIVGT